MRKQKEQKILMQTEKEEVPNWPSYTEISSSISSEYYKYKNYYENPDTLVDKKGLTVYRDMRVEDEQVRAILQFKKYARLSTGWDIQPASENETDIEIADFVRSNLQGIKGTIEQKLFEIMSALDYGFSVSEILWKVIETGKWKGYIGLKGIKTRQPFGFDFDTDDYDNLKSDGLVQEGVHGSNVRHPPEKFIIYSYQKEFDNYYGLSDLRSVFRAWFAKKIIFRAWLIFLDRFGMPTAVGTYPDGAKDESVDQFRTILKNLQIKTSITKPAGWDIDFLESSRQGGNPFLEAIEKCDIMIARGILCPDLLGFSVKPQGSYALGEKHFEAFIWILEKLGQDLEVDVMGEQLIQKLIDYNFQVEAYPRFKFKTLTGPNYENRAKIIEMALMHGLVNGSEIWVRDYLGLPPKIAIQHTIEKLQSEKREITPYEEKIDFGNIKTFFAKVDGDFYQDLRDLIGEFIQDIKKQIEKRDIGEKIDIAAINKIAVLDDEKVADIIFKYMKRTYLQSKKDIRNVIEKNKDKFKKLAEISWSLPSAEAMKVMRGKSSSVARIQNARIREKVRQILYEGLSSGQSTKFMIAKVSDYFHQYLEEEGRPSQLISVVRTNLTDAYTQGQLAMMRDVDIAGDIPSVQFSAILDDRTSPICRQMDEKIFPLDSKWTNIYRPPLHHNCRSMLVPVFAFEDYKDTAEKTLAGSLKLIPEDFNRT